MACTTDVNSYSFSLNSINSSTCTPSPIGCNLIQNPSFEDLTVPCTSLALSGPGDGSPVCFWDFPNVCPLNIGTAGTPDFIASCGIYNNFVFGTTFDFNTNANTGSISGGIFTFAKTSTGGDFREYISQGLSTPLVSGKLYNLSLYTKAAPMGRFTSSLSAFFSNVNLCQPDVASIPLSSYVG